MKRRTYVKFGKILLGIFLLVFWFFASLFFVNEISFSVITNNHEYLSSKNISSPLMKNQKMEGEFIASNSNLGLIVLAFKKYSKPEFSKEDTLLFQLKEKESQEIVFENKYRSGLIENDKLFIGFPPIKNSQNKKYEFLLLSLEGNSKNFVKSENSFISGYQFLFKDIFGNKSSLIQFFSGKIISNFESINFFLSSILFLIPFLIYVLWIFLKHKRSLLKRYLWFLTGSVIFSEIFVFEKSYFGIQILIIILWIFSILAYRLKSKISFFMSFGLIFLWILLFYLGRDDYSYKINFLAYAFLVIGTIQLIWENKKN